MGRQVSLINGPQVVGASSFFSSGGVGFSIMAAGPWAAAGLKENPHPHRRTITKSIGTLLQ